MLVSHLVLRPPKSSSSRAASSHHQSWADRLATLPWDSDHVDPLFDATWYLATYPDVVDAGQDAWEHFRELGALEDRQPSASFDSAFYRACYGPPAAAPAFLHYRLIGDGSGYLAQPFRRTLQESRQAMRRALSPSRHPVLLVGHDASRTGAPLLLLELASNLRLRGFAPTFVLQRSGPLAREYRRYGQVFVLDEGWVVPGLGASLPARVPVLGCTAWSARIIRDLTPRGRVAVMVHEMPEYVRAHGLHADLAEVSQVIASMPAIATGLTPLLQEAARGQVPEVHVAVPGLPATRITRRQHQGVALQTAQAWSASDPVFIGAGLADERKGFDRFLAAARDVAEREPRARFVWLGELTPWAARLAADAIEDGLPLLLPGFRSDSLAWYSRASVYLLTSRQDPGPTTVIQAALAGTPFVAYASDIGLASLDADLGTVGQFVADDDQDAFVEAALKLARQDRTATRRARARLVKAATSFDRYADELLEMWLPWPATASFQPRPGVQRLRTRLRAARRLKRMVRFGPWFALLWVNRRTGHPALDRVLSVPFLRRIAPHPSTAARDAPLVVVVTEREGEASPEAIGSQDDVAELGFGERVALTDVRLLGQISCPAVVHVIRERRTPDAPVWGTTERAVAEAAGQIVALHQYPWDHRPRWAQLGHPPPPARWPHAPVIGRARPTELPLSASGVRPLRPLGVYMHVFYIETLELLASRLAHIRHPVTLHVSCDTAQKAERIRSVLGPCDVRILPNVGADIYPKLFGFADTYADHDLVLHLHGKRSGHDPNLQPWFEHILDCLLPDPERVDAILEAFDQDPSLGMVAPTPFPYILPSYHWTHNRAIAEALLWGRGWHPLPQGRRLAFPAGSMFWSRTDALGPLLRLELDQSAFLAGRAPLDATLAHALERLLGVSCVEAGLRFVFVAPGASASAV